MTMRSWQAPVLLAWLSLLACGSEEAPPPLTPSAQADESVGNEAGAEPSPSAPSAEEAPTGVPACDRYLELYRVCEPALAEDIAGGDRRSFRAERGWVEYMAGEHPPEAMEEECASMQADLPEACTFGGEP